jgi:glycosyltransferase involved in cell wall biosynthesis
MGRQRVLHCIASMGGGGAERQLSYLARGLMRRGWDVHVALTTGGPNLNALESSGAVIHSLPVHAGLLLPKLTTLMWRLRPDIVQTWLPKMDIIGGIAARLAGLPCVLSERNSRASYPFPTRNRVRAFLGARSDAIVTNSQTGIEYWRGRVRNERQLHHIPNTVPADEVAAAPEADYSGIALSPDHLLVLYAGRLDEQKNVVTLAQAFERVVASSPRVLAMICGEGPLRERLIDFANRSPYSKRILVRGYVNALWSWMKRADVFVSVSLYEGRPNTVLEAMASGCPLVVSDIPEHREILDGQTAVFVPPESPDEIAAGVSGVLANRGAAVLRAAGARTAVQQWSIEEIAMRYESVYLETLAAASRTPLTAAGG